MTFRTFARALAAAISLILPSHSALTQGGPARCRRRSVILASTVRPLCSRPGARSGEWGCRGARLCPCPMGRHLDHHHHQLLDAIVEAQGDPSEP